MSKMKDESQVSRLGSSDPSGIRTRDHAPLNPSESGHFSPALNKPTAPSTNPLPSVLAPAEGFKPPSPPPRQINDSAGFAPPLNALTGSGTDPLPIHAPGDGCRPCDAVRSASGAAPLRDRVFAARDSAVIAVIGAARTSELLREAATVSILQGSVELAGELRARAWQLEQVAGDAGGLLPVHFDCRMEILVAIGELDLAEVRS